jgi:RHS repeat-associated protein
MTTAARLVLIPAIVSMALTSSAPQRLRAQQGVAGANEQGQTATLLSDGSILLLGGEGSRATARIFDPAMRSTRAVGRPGTPRAWHTATTLPDGRVLIAGGIGADGQIVADAETLDPTTGEFTKAEVSFTPRARHTATVLSDGRVLFAGGETPGGGGLRAELWDAAANVSDAVPGPPFIERLDGRARLLPDGRVHVTGGRNRTGGEPVDEVFDPALSAFVRSDTGVVEAPAGAVAGVLPANGAVDVPLTSRISLRFAEPIDVRSIAVALERIDGVRVPATLVVAENGLLVFLTPGAALAADTTYRITSGRARTATGDALPEFSSMFRTARTPEPTDPGASPDPSEATGSGLDSPWRKLPPLEAPPGVTALAGQVLLLNGQPLADVTLAIGARRVHTDRTGRFLIRLGSHPSGWRELLIDGTTANRGQQTYGVFEVAAQIVGRTTAALPYTIWMPEIDTANAVRIPSPTVRDTVITTPRISGLALHLPPHTTITDHRGKIVREISITPIPVAQPPFPLPAGVEVPVYFTIQPGGAYVAVMAYGNERRGARLVYPNYTRQPAGTDMQFWHYDPEEKGWHVYGMGKVSVDGGHVVPNPGVGIYEFTGAMINGGQSPGPPGGNGPPGADPVDLSTGEFVMKKVDLAVSDVIPLTLTRTYRSADSGSRAFGIGSMHPYAMFLWSAQQYQEADLILPDGQRIHYVRTSPGTSFTDAEFTHTATPTGFYKSRLAWNGNGWDLTLKDGTVFVFGDSAPLQAIRDRFGNQVTITWSATGPSGSGIGKILRVTSPNGRWIAFTYDGSNRITQAKDHLDRTVGYEYDTSGRVKKVTDARGGVTEYTYDIAHRMLTIKDPRNIVYLTNEYDTNGRVDEQTQADSGVWDFAYTLNGSQVTQTDLTNPRGYVRRLTFNTDRFLTSDTHALGQTIEQTTTYARLSGSNLVETVTDELARVTRYAYDSKGNVTSVSELDGTADEVTTTVTYDSAYSLVTSVTDPLNHTTSIAYDSLGRLQSATDALSHATTFTTNGAGQVLTATTALSKTTTLGYAQGDLVTVQTPLGHAQTRVTDAAGRLVSATDALAAVTRFEYHAQDQVTKIIDPRGGETTFTYDGNGNLLTLTDARGKTTTWTYDSMDRVATRTDPLTRAESFEYDLNGNLTKWTDRKGQVTTYQYDALDRQTFVGFGTTGTPPSYASTITTSYDAGNRATDIVDSVAGTIERTYDLLDRLTEEVTPEGTVTYTYDDAGRRETMTVAGQTAVSYNYDNADRLTGVTRGTASVMIAYDNADRRTSLTLPNGIVVEYAYDDDSRVTGLTYKQGTSTLGTLTYGYNANGQRTSVGGTYARTGLPAALASATYDDANQVATWAGTNFSYDSNGNLTSDGAKAYSWNARNKLTGISGGATASFGYDGFGRRRTTTVSGTTTEFLYDGLNPVQELSGGSPTANLLTGLGIDEYFTRTDAAGVRNFLTDALGSTVALADTSGTMQTEYTYEPFGKSTKSGAATTSSYGFTGREEDGIGLYFYRARYYDARLQRFSGEDPLGLQGGDTNLFAYVNNDPIRLRDPLGLQAVNNSPYPWWVKPGDGEVPVCVPPGGTYPKPIDGLGSPGSPRPGEVFKIPDYTWVVVGADNVPRVYTPPPWVPIVIYVPPSGLVHVPPVRVPWLPRPYGWQPRSFADTRPDWIPLFDRIPPPPKGRKPPPSCPEK